MARPGTASGLTGSVLTPSPAVQPPELRILLDSTLSRGTLDGAWWPLFEGPGGRAPGPDQRPGRTGRPNHLRGAERHRLGLQSSRIVVGGGIVWEGWFTVLDPDTGSHRNPSGCRVSRPHQHRRNSASATCTRRSWTSPASASAPPHRRDRGHRPDHRLQMRQRPHVAERLTTGVQHHSHIEQDLAPVVDRVEPPPRHRRRQPVWGATSASRL